jgi:UDP-glucose 4-epimerase
MMDEFLALGYHKEFELPVVILRLFNTVGPRQSGRYGMVIPRFVSQAIVGDPITVYGDGSQTRCFGYVGDVVGAMAEIAQLPEAEGQVFNVGSNREISINGLAALVKETLTSSSPIVNVPYQEAFGADFEEIPRRVPDIGKIQVYIDFHPDTELATIIEQVAGHQRQEALGDVEVT